LNQTADDEPVDFDALLDQMPDDLKKELDKVGSDIAESISRECFTPEALLSGQTETEKSTVEEVQRTPPVEASSDERPSNASIDLLDGGITMTYITKVARGCARINEGSMIGFRMHDGEPLREDVFGSSALPWALEEVVKRLSVGEIVEVIGRGAYAFADDEKLLLGEERQWRFELVSVGDQGKDKFQLKADERIAKANEMRERGNCMMKKARHLRAASYYERGSALMDIIEAEDMGGMSGMGMGGGDMGGMPGMPPNMQGVLDKKDAKAVETNKRIRTCQMPLLLNWALVLIKLGKFQEAERKLTEVLLDIDKTCVKALFRRGQCHIELGNLQEARSDLRRAQELDQSVSVDVEKELAKLDRRQKAQDTKDKNRAKKMLAGAFGDERSDKKTETNATQDEDENEGLDIRVKESSATRVNTSASDGDLKDLPSLLEAQERKSDENGVDELTWCRQREAIYNQFMRPQVPSA